METLFDQYKELNINGSLICLEQVEDIYSYFCYPTNAKAIGFEGSIAGRKAGNRTALLFL